MLKINNHFSIDQKVYLASDPDQVERRVLKIIVTPTGLMYTVRMDGAEVDVYEIELSTDRNVI